MADKIISISIDVTKIDKARLYPGKNGAKYFNATLLYNEDKDQYENNGPIIEDVTKDERTAGKKGTIVGNAKERVQAGKTPAPKANYAQPADEAGDDLPF